MLTPHGGILQDLIARDASKKADLIAESLTLQSLDLTDRQLCDLELILNGGFSPLTGFNNKKDYEAICNDMRLANGQIWSIPITLDVSEETSKLFTEGERVVLRDPRDDAPLAIITVADIYKPNKQEEAKKVFRGDPEHPAIRYLLDTAGDYYIGGDLDAISLPKHYDYTEFRKTPAQLRSEFQSRHWNKVVAFQTRNPMHRAHRELTVRAAKDKLANLLIHPVVGLTKPGDIDHHTRVKVYQEIIKKYPNGMAKLSLLPLAMRMAGDREAVWHAIIRKNYGATHFIVGRDHAGPGSNSKGVDFYGPYDAQTLVEKFANELEIEVVPFRMVTYLPDEDRYSPIDLVPAGTTTCSISGTELRKRLRDGTEIPAWFSYPEVVKILRTSHPPRPSQGFALYLSGLPFSGIHALSYALQATFNQFQGGRHITLIDADSVNTESLPFVVSELVRSGAGVIVANAKEVLGDIEYSSLKKTVSKAGSFITVSIETPLDICKANDRSGFYSSEAGEKAISTYKPIAEAEISADLSIEDSLNVAIQKIVLYLEEQGFFKF
jgi:sulfate adenylyltransferase